MAHQQSPGEQLYHVAQWGNWTEARRILTENPAELVNWINPTNGRTALYIACLSGHDRVVEVLLASPTIDPNILCQGWTSLYVACFANKVRCVRLLLRDPRVGLQTPNANGKRPFGFCVRENRLEIVRWWLASGRLNLQGEGPLTFIAKTRQRGLTEMADLLEGFRANPAVAIHQLRLAIGWFDEASADFFAQMVFLSDGLLELPVPSVEELPANVAGRMRFFRIAGRLPMELQMVLSNRAVRSPRDGITGEQRERAFRDAARRLH